MKLKDIDKNAYVQVRSKEEFFKLVTHARNIGYLTFSIYNLPGSTLYHLGSRYFNIYTGNYLTRVSKPDIVVQFNEIDFDDTFIEVWFM